MIRFTVVLLFCFLSLQVSAQRPAPDKIETGSGTLSVHPVNHGCVAIQWNDKTILVDPYGGKSLFEGLPLPDLVLLTDIHQDHLDTATLFPLLKDNSIIVAPEAVADKITGKHAPKVKVLANGHSETVSGIRIVAMPMYNLPDDATSRHPKGRGNGYVLYLADRYVYISGDTEDIPEMRELKNIDIAFVCMNEPYTMSVAQAAEAVLAFNPRIVYPYHYRGQNGFSDLQEFKKLVAAGNTDIEVRIRDWYSAAGK